jgi:hypothetical protein
MVDRRSDGASLDLFLGEQSEEALEPVDPRRGCRPVPAWALGEPVTDQLRLVARGVVHDDMDVRRHIVFDLVEEIA